MIDAPSDLYVTELKCERCDFGAFAVLDDSGTRWKLACIYCNLRMDGPALRDRPEYMTAAASSAPAGRLEFREGRYSGRTIAELSGTTAGMEYLRWYAKLGKSQFMRSRVAEFIGLLGE